MALNPKQRANERFYEQVWPHRADVLRVARSVTSNATEAEDLAGETLLEAVESIESLAPEANTGGWLMQIFENIRTQRSQGLSKPAVNLNDEKVRSIVVDTSRLDAFIELQLRQPDAGPSRFILRRQTLRAISISLIVVSLATALLWSLSGRTAVASPDVLARFHQELISDNGDAAPVDSIIAAKKVLAERGFEVEIPRLSTRPVVRCFIRKIQNKQVACVLLKSEEGIDVTMAVADSSDMRIPPSQRKVDPVKGVEYHAIDSGKLHLVMTDRRGRWVCFISQLSADRLIEFASEMQF